MKNQKPGIIYITIEGEIKIIKPEEE